MTAGNSSKPQVFSVLNQVHSEALINRMIDRYESEVGPIGRQSEQLARANLIPTMSATSRLSAKLYYEIADKAAITDSSDLVVGDTVLAAGSELSMDALDGEIQNLDLFITGNSPVITSLYHRNRTQAYSLMVGDPVFLSDGRSRLAMEGGQAVVTPKPKATHHTQRSLKRIEELSSMIIGATEAPSQDLTA